MLTSILKRKRETDDMVEDEQPSNMSGLSVSFSKTTNVRNIPRWEKRCDITTRRLWMFCLKCRQEIQAELNLYKATEMEIHPESKLKTRFYRHLLPSNMKMSARQEEWSEAVLNHMKLGTVKCNIHQAMQNKSWKTLISPRVLKRLRTPRKFNSLARRKLPPTRISSGRNPKVKKKRVFKKTEKKLNR